MGCRKFLNKKEFNEYSDLWKNFKHKNVLESEYNVHSSKPAISKIMYYNGYENPILRAKINQKKLREFDPYFNFKKYANPFWHIQHYMMVAEQMYHAGSNMLRDNSKLVMKDTMEEFNALRPIFWRNNSKHISIELMIEKNNDNKNNSFLFVEDLHFYFYNEKTNREVANIHAKSYAQYRSYIRDMNMIESSKNDFEIENAKSGLIRKIESQIIKQNDLAINPRKDIVDGLYLIEEINRDNLPKDDIINYFSLWQPSGN